MVALVSATGASAQDGPGVYVTRNGFRMPIYGVSQVLDATGDAVTACAPLTSPQVDAARFGRQVSRTMAASLPLAVVSGGEGGATFNVTYTDAEGVGFYDAAGGATRRRALEAALTAWAKASRASQPIAVHASMHEMDDATTIHRRRCWRRPGRPTCGCSTTGSRRARSPGRNSAAVMKTPRTPTLRST